MSDLFQGTLPFNEYNGHRLVVNLRGPRITPQFVATGGLLHAYHPYTNEPLPAHEYPQPPEWAFDEEGEDDDAGGNHSGGEPEAGIPTPVNTSEIPFEEQVAGYVEHTAQVLFESIQDTAELERVARRFQNRKRAVSRTTAEGLRDEQGELNTFFGEVLEHYCIHMGANATEALAQWVAETAELLDQTPAPGKGRKAEYDDPNEVSCYYRGW